MRSDAAHQPADAHVLEHVVDQLHDALNHRTDIGIAIGRLMEHYDIDRGRALAALKRISQETNRKVRDIAADIAGGGPLPLDHSTDRHQV